MGMDVIYNKGFNSFYPRTSVSGLGSTTLRAELPSLHGQDLDVQSQCQGKEAWSKAVTLD